MQTVGVTPQSLQHLLAHSLDYAGLFPPASLDLEQSVRNYSEYLEHPEAWMLGRFICPTSRTDELIGLLHEAPPSSPWQLSVLGTGGQDADGFLQALERDLSIVERIAGRGIGLLDIASMEVRWPAEALDMPFAETTLLLDRVIGKLAEALVRLPELFFELPARSHHREIREILRSISRSNSRRLPGDRSLIGAKIRCGGTEPSAFPAVEELAAFLSACTQAGVPFKATAGLHHPMYHLDSALGVHMHGFLNVFTASVLLSERILDEQDARALLADGDVSHFELKADGLAWKGRAVSADVIARARNASILSFGSCSFEEPIEDLKRLGLM